MNTNNENGARLARCAICGEVDNLENLYGVDVYPVIFSVHDGCIPLYVDDPQSIEAIVHQCDHEPPGIWGWDQGGAFVALREVERIRAFLDAHDIPYHTQ